MDSSSASDEEDQNLENWNDWRSLEDKVTVPEIKLNERIFLGDGKIKSLTSVSDVTNADKFGNWIPPPKFNCDESMESARRTFRKIKRLTANNGKRCSLFDESSQNTNESLFAGKTLADTPNQSVSNVFNVQRYLDKTGVNLLSESKYFNQSISDILDESLQKDTYEINDYFPWEKVLNSDWGKRTELHDVANFTIGDVMWGVVSRGVFGIIKLWENEYGNLCGSAEGKISKEGSSEMTSIFITDIQILRKFLGLTTQQWSSLLEIAQKSKKMLKYEALIDQSLEKMSPLEKLWYFTCKRRHFLQDQCMLVKFSGAVKSIAEFKIIPKLVVQDIRDIRGQEIF